MTPRLVTEKEANAPSYYLPRTNKQTNKPTKPSESNDPTTYQCELQTKVTVNQSDSYSPAQHNTKQHLESILSEASNHWPHKPTQDSTLQARNTTEEAKEGGGSRPLAIKGQGKERIPTPTGCRARAWPQASDSDQHWMVMNKVGLTYSSGPAVAAEPKPTSASNFTSTPCYIIIMHRRVV